MPLSTIEKGLIAENEVANNLTRRGYQVSKPLSPCKYDLIVDRDGFLERIQVKFTRSDGEMIDVKCRATPKPDKIHKYTSEDVEWLAVYDFTTDQCFYIPAKELEGGRASMRLRLQPTRNNQRRARDASDYTDFKHA